MRGGVLFDLDETLIDRARSMELYVDRLYEDFSTHIDEPLPSFRARLMELDGGGYVAREVFCARVADVVDTPAVDAAGLIRHFYAYAWDVTVAMAGAVEGIRRLKAGGVPVGIVTNGGSANQRKKLRTSGLGALVDCVVVSEEVGVRKPEAEIFRIAADRLRIAPARSWFIGDNPAVDIVGARDAGFRAIWLRGTLPWPDGQPHCYAASVGSLDEAVACAGASFGSGCLQDEDETSGSE